MVGYVVSREEEVMGKRAMISRNKAWRLALAENRVIKTNDSLTSFPTIEMRDARIVDLNAAGLPWAIVQASP
jgi:hypothetical protein